MKSKAIREHDRVRRKERWAMKVMHWFLQHDWVSGFGLAGYGLAAEGYTDYPHVGPAEFSIMRTGVDRETREVADESELPEMGHEETRGDRTHRHTSPAGPAKTRVVD